MKKIVFPFLVAVMVAIAGLYLNAKTVQCEDCSQGKNCDTSYDCGEIGVCYCQYSYEEEQSMGGAIPQNGTCYFE